MNSIKGRPPFRLGLNYWPARTAMGWWPAFEREEVAVDFAKIKAAGFDSVRLFLTWEHFQPHADQIDQLMIKRLISTFDLASDAGLLIMPTLFTGHMSGVNWIPKWALGGTDGDHRFRTLSGGRIVEDGLRNWYIDESVAYAQSFLARELALCLAGHPALYAWDLGNENSNCTIPRTQERARSWLGKMSDAIRGSDSSALITIGLHMEDLEQDRRLGPAEAAASCDFLTMHGYPGYATFTQGPTDEQLLPFLVHITRWLAGGSEVLFSEFGVPTYRAHDAEGKSAKDACTTPLVEEEEAAAYVERSLSALYECGSAGAMLWCYADYVKDIWQDPPLDVAIHERYFGQWRADGSPKPAVSKIMNWAKQRLSAKTPDSDNGWIDIDPCDFYQSGESQLARLYQRYQSAHSINDE